MVVAQRIPKIGEALRTARKGTVGHTRGREGTKDGTSCPVFMVPALSVDPRGRARKFGREGNFDHYGTQQCTTRTGMSSSSSTNQRLFQQSCGACPDMYPNFKRAR